MATKTKFLTNKTKFLTKDERHFLVSAEQQFYPGLIKYINENGYLPNDFSAKYIQKYGEKGSEKYLLSYQQTVDKFKQPGIYEDFIKKTAKESDLTSAELQDRLEAFQGLGNVPPKSVTKVKEFEDFLTTEITDQVHGQFKDVSITREVAEKVARAISGRLLKNEDVTDQEIAERIQNEGSAGEGAAIFDGDQFERLKKVVAPNVKKTVSLNKDKFVNVKVPFDVSKDVTRLQDLISTKQAAEAKRGEIESFVSGLPEELRSSREEFISGEEERAFSELERQVPLVLQDLNVRGMLQSGERMDALTTKALSLGASLEEIQADLEAEDNQFYFDAAYKNAIRDELDKAESYRSAIGAERGRITTERERKFRSAEAELDRQLGENLTRSEYARNAALQRRSRQSQQKNQQAEVIPKIAETATNIATAVILKKIG